MGAVLILAVAVFLVWANLTTVRALRSRRAGVVWWAALAVLWAAGAAIGVWGGFFFEYQASPRLRVFGAPLPAGMSQLNGPPGQEVWVGFVTPVPILFAAANVPLVGLFAGSLVGMAFRLWRGRRARLCPAPTVRSP